MPRGRPLAAHTPRRKEARSLSWLRRIKCKKGHSRHDAYVKIRKHGGIELECRTCKRERDKKYYNEGRTYRYH